MRPRSILLLIAMSAATSLALTLSYASEAGAYQHVANGGFENGLSGWSTAPGVALAIANDIPPAEGEASARLTITGGSALLRYRIDDALAAGAYLLSLSARSAAPNVTVALALQPDDSGAQRLDVAIASVAPDWGGVAGPAQLSNATTATVSVRVSGPDGAAVHIDAVRLEGAAPVTLTATPTATAFVQATPTLSTLVPHAPSPTPAASATATPEAAVDVIGPALRNGGFEQTDASGALVAWEKYGGAMSVSPRANGGVQAAQLTSATESTKWLHQTVTVAPDTWYGLDAWLLHDDPAVAAAFLRVSWYASADASGTAISTTDSTHRLDTAATEYRPLTTGAILSPSDARSARVRIMLAPASAVPASILVDDAVFYPTDAPPVQQEPPATAIAPGAPVQRLESAPAGQSGTAVRRRSGASASTLPVVAPGAPSRSIVLNEVLYDADSDVPDADAEWVELYNTTDAPIDVGGWSLHDATGTDVIPMLLIPARGFAIIAATSAFAAAYPALDAPVAVLGSRIGNALGNDGDRLYLVDTVGATVDAVSWGDDASVFDPSFDDIPAGHSMERRIAGVDSDKSSDFIDNGNPSPGGSFVANEGNPKPQIGPSVQVLAGSGEADWGWAPWVLASLSLAACGATIAWRALGAVRERALRP